MRALLLLAVFTAGCVEDPDRRAPSGFCGTGAPLATRRMLGFLVDAPPPAPPGPDLTQLRTMFQAAKNQIRAQRFSEAKSLLQQISDASPSFGGGTVQQYLAHVDNELDNSEHLRAAEQMTQLDPAGAARELALVRTGTVQTDRRDAVARNLKTHLSNRLVEARNLADEIEDLEKMRQLMGIVDEVLSADPENTEATVLKKIAEQALVPRHPAHSHEISQALFASGDSAGAAAIARGCSPWSIECKRLAEDLALFDVSYQRLGELPIKALPALLTLAKKISGTDSGGTFGRRVSKRQRGVTILEH